ncbi:hypothetical protein [Flavobacterium sp. PL02]|jgi:hypothetical protein|uniref:DUF7336 domain-containing protein n=1 Tax=Flavobacterium sp. PL02 TaxID=3088354 RepID=UPI002B226969|nr:hypothetical protein [Flavobacterium sp. PL02]MEA9412262.1 hypothetical protein [Flavobacterium sp. PL02]
MSKKLEMMKEKIYILEHVYTEDEIDEIKFIGVFSSKANVQLVILELKDKPGFKLHPVECFIISEDVLDNYGWKEGFGW